MRKDVVSVGQIVHMNSIVGLLLLVWFAVAFVVVVVVVVDVVDVVVVVVDVQPGLSVHGHCRPAPGSYNPGPALGEGKYQVSALNLLDSLLLVIGHHVDGLPGVRGQVWEGDQVQRGQGEVLGSGPCQQEEGTC